MTVGQKVSDMKVVLARVVGMCNEAENFRLATAAQSCLTQVGNFSAFLETGENAEVAKQEIKTA